MEQIYLKADDGYELSLHVYERKNPKAVVQIAHGMEEHQGRYDDFAKYLVKNGFAVVSADMRGHGENAEDLGHFAKKNGEKLLVGDHKTIRDYIAEKFKGLPIYLFSHSMGTIIARVVLQECSQKYDKVILSGYPAYQSAASLGVALTKLLSRVKGVKYKSKLIEKLGLNAFNSKIKKPRTDIDWICSNEETIEAYQGDDLCGIGFSLSAFNDLFQLVVQMEKSQDYKNVNADLPILLLAGQNDPCTKGDRGRAHSRQTLEKAGFKNITQTTYSNMRHEILNEKENIKVYNDIVNFYNFK